MEIYIEQMKERLDEINKIIDAKAQNPVTLIGVTKGFSHEEVNIASELVIKSFGEPFPPNFNFSKMLNFDPTSLLILDFNLLSL